MRLGSVADRLSWVGSGTFGKGPATVSLSVAPNPGVVRAATISVAGTAVTIVQGEDSGSCAYSIDAEPGACLAGKNGVIECYRRHELPMGRFELSRLGDSRPAHWGGQWKRRLHRRSGYVIVLALDDVLLVMNATVTNITTMLTALAEGCEC